MSYARADEVRLRDRRARNPYREGQRKRIAFITDGFVARKLLDHLGLDSEPPIPAPARTLEESVFAW